MQSVSTGLHFQNFFNVQICQHFKIRPEMCPNFGVSGQTFTKKNFKQKNATWQFKFNLFRVVESTSLSNNLHLPISQWTISSTICNFQLMIWLFETLINVHFPISLTLSLSLSLSSLLSPLQPIVHMKSVNVAASYAPYPIPTTSLYPRPIPWRALSQLLDTDRWLFTWGSILYVAFFFFFAC